MNAFEVFLNGERLCLAGIDGNCVLSTVIDHVNKAEARDELDLYVGGLVSDTGEHVNWGRTQLNTGDEVRVRIIESDSADEPIERRPRDPAQEFERQKQYVRQMAKQLGWTLAEPTNTPSALGEPKTSE